MSKEIISSGLWSSGAIISSGMSMYVLSGGTLTSATVNYKGKLYVSNGGYASRITMEQNGSMRVGYGGTATSIAVTGSQAILDISGVARLVSASGASASNVNIIVKGLLQSGTLATYGGVMTVLENGVASGVNVCSSSLLNISSGGRGVYVSLGNRGSGIVHSGGYVTNAYVSSGGRMVVSEGGEVYNAVLKAGATLHVHRGGSARVNWSVGQGTVSTAPGAKVSYMNSSSYQGVVQCDHSGNVTSNPSVDGGSIVGSLYVFKGGSVSGVSVESGGTLEVWSGGTASNVVWTPGAGNLRVHEGGTITFRQNYTGVYVSDFSASDVEHTTSASNVGSGGKAYVMNGGVLQGGSVTYAAAFVWSGGMAKNMTIAQDSFITVSDGGVAFKNHVWGAELHVFSGGVAHETTVANTSKGCIVVFSGGNANNTIVSGTSGNLGSCIVSSGGVANRVSANQGKVIVHTSGVVHSAHLENNAKALLSGGLANSTLVDSNSELYVYDSGLALDTVASNGALHVSAGGITRRTELDEYSTLNVWENGSAYATTVNHGDLNVYDCGAAYSNTVNSDGALYVWSGGSAANNAITGGELTIWEGGEVRNTVLNEGADLYIWEGGKHTGTLTVSADSEVYADSGSVIDFSLVGRTASDGFLINDLSRIDGSPQYSITVSYSQTDGVYKLAQNADWLYSVALYNDGGEKLGNLAVNGEALVYDDISYSLSLQAGNLMLSHQDLTLTVKAVEKLAGKNDLDNNGLADVILHHTKQGYAGAWLATGSASIISWGNLTNVKSGTVILGTGTAYGSETDGEDIFYTDGSSVGVWKVSAGKITGYQGIMNVNATTNVLGLGDFNGDGATDLLLRAKSGDLGFFQTDGTGWHYLKGLGLEWDVSAIGDLNGDGRDDVVLRHSTGFAGTFLTQSDSSVKWKNLDTLAANMEILGTGDFNGDGIDDVLLRNNENNWIGAWIVDDGSVDSFMGICTNANTIEQIADFNGDGIDDLRLRSAKGDIGVLYVKGADTTQWQYFQSVGSEWSTAFAAEVK